MVDKIKKCAVEGCGKPAVGSVPTTIVENNEVKSGYMYYCEEHFMLGIKDVLSLRGEKGMVNIIVPENGKISITIRNYLQNEKAGVSLNDEEVKAVIEFLKKALL